MHVFDAILRRVDLPANETNLKFKTTERCDTIIRPYYSLLAFKAQILLRLIVVAY